jgi:hypothetical protein
MKFLYCFVIFHFFLINILFAQNNNDEIFVTKKGSVGFVSDAPLELIEASSDKLKGVLKLSDRTFAFGFDIKTFEGFNSPLQRVHFNENYMESDKHEKGTFQGKIIEEIDLTQSGSYRIRAKGILSIHGVEQQRIIRCRVRSGNNRIYISADFTVFLDEHNIKIPSIVYQKIAEEVSVEIEAELVPKR